MRKFSNENVFIKFGGKFTVFHAVRDFKRNIERFKYAWQRIDRGYSDMDLWNFDTYLQNVISGGLKDMSENISGYPESYGSYENWTKALSDIADLVKRINPDDCIDWEKDDISLADYDDATEESDIAREVVFDWFKKNWCNLWD